jgi:hypothetical protein
LRVLHFRLFPQRRTADEPETPSGIVQFRTRPTSTLPLAPVGQAVIRGASEVRGPNDDTRLGIEFQLDLNLVADLHTGGLSLGIAQAKRKRPRMIATLLLHECPLIVIVTRGRLP